MTSKYLGLSLSNIIMRWQGQKPLSRVSEKSFPRTNPTGLWILHNVPAKIMINAHFCQLQVSVFKWDLFKNGTLIDSFLSVCPYPYVTASFSYETQFLMMIALIVELVVETIYLEKKSVVCAWIFPHPPVQKARDHIH